MPPVSTSKPIEKVDSQAQETQTYETQAQDTVQLSELANPSHLIARERSTRTFQSVCRQVAYAVAGMLATSGFLSKENSANAATATISGSAEVYDTQAEYPVEDFPLNWGTTFEYNFVVDTNTPLDPASSETTARYRGAITSGYIKSPENGIEQADVSVDFSWVRVRDTPNGDSVIFDVEILGDGLNPFVMTFGTNDLSDDPTLTSQDLEEALRALGEGGFASNDWWVEGGGMYMSGAFNDIQVTIEETVLPGDYNQDGAVDLADYTVWRDHLGSMESPFADGDGSGVVDAADYELWKDNFGRMLDAPQESASVSVPEPGSFALLAGAGFTAAAAAAARNRKK